MTPIAPTLAETIKIDGPLGPLSAEILPVQGADHVVVIIPGSGETDRDGNPFQTYRLLAEGLAKHGIASLRIDKRGLFGSAAAIRDPNDVTIADYAQDARDWAEHATTLAPCVWIAGHSEGGLVALVAARRPLDGLCGLILLATPGRPVGQILQEQLNNNPVNSALMPEIRVVIAKLEARNRVDPELLSPAIRQLFRMEIQPFMIDWFSHDPTEIAQHWKGPTLIIQGDADIQVKRLDVEMLDAALTNAEAVILPNATHVLKADVPYKPVATYTDPSSPLHPELITQIVNFLAQHPSQ